MPCVSRKWTWALCRRGATGYLKGPWPASPPRSVPGPKVPWESGPRDPGHHKNPPRGAYLFDVVYAFSPARSGGSRGSASHELGRCRPDQGRGEIKLSLGLRHTRVVYPARTRSVPFTPRPVISWQILVESASPAPVYCGTVYAAAPHCCSIAAMGTEGIVYCPPPSVTGLACVGLDAATVVHAGYHVHGTFPLLSSPLQPSPTLSYPIPSSPLLSSPFSPAPFLAVIPTSPVSVRLLSQAFQDWHVANPAPRRGNRAHSRIRASALACPSRSAANVSKTSAPV